MFSYLKIFFNTLKNHFYSEKKNIEKEPYFETINEKYKICLVLGSGGSKGLCHIGVLEELIKNNIKIDIIIGCSVGSLVGALYASNNDVEKLKEIVFSVPKDFILSFNNSFMGINSVYGIKKFVKKFAKSNFDSLKIPLIITTTNLTTGKIQLFNKGNLATAVSASCAIPLYFTPVKINDQMYSDGAIINPCPTIFGKILLNSQIVIASHINPLSSTYVTPNNMLSIAKRSLDILYFHRSNDCSKYADIIIQHHVNQMDSISVKKPYSLYEKGKNATKIKIKEIKNLISKYKKHKI